ncbi:MAG: hypothetical protein E6Q97_16010 [Desulfurellales bacterium]|nr:MAG: hypothetical protein E6Q97_16010 [Desulfurellales bacterium]
MSTGMITPVTLRRLRTTYDSGLQDVGQILTYVAPTPNAYGAGNATYTAGSIVRCLVREYPINEAKGEGFGGAQVAQNYATLFLPRDTSINNRNRFKLTKIRGVTLASPRTYEIVAGPQQDQVHHRATLRLVTDGSDS